MPSVTDRPQVCEACGGDGGGDYCTGHYGGEPVYQHVTCSECGGAGQIDVFTSREIVLLPGEKHQASDDLFDWGDEIPF